MVKDKINIFLIVIFVVLVLVFGVLFFNKNDYNKISEVFVLNDGKIRIIYDDGFSEDGKLDFFNYDKEKLISFFWLFKQPSEIASHLEAQTYIKKGEKYIKINVVYVDGTKVDLKDYNLIN